MRSRLYGSEWSVTIVAMSPFTITIDTPEAALAQILTAPPIRPATVFSLTLIAVTMLPICTIGFALTYPAIGVAVAVLLTLASTHVFATAYLFSDPEVRRFMAEHPKKMIVVPCAIIGIGMMLFSNPESPIFVPLILVFFLYQTWHFGSQNIGVASFISLSDRSRPLARIEKATIKIGTIVGMLGVVHIMAPSYVIGEKYVSLGPASTEIVELAYRIGLFAAAFVSGIAVIFAVIALRQRHYVFSIGIFVSITFLFTMYVSQDYRIGFLSFSIAHGLQYIVFLFTHSLSAGKRRTSSSAGMAIAMAIATLAIVVMVGNFIWITTPDVKIHAAPAGLALILSLTLVHFWFDQFLWQMKNKDRAIWIRSRFGFVLR